MWLGSAGLALVAPQRAALEALRADDVVLAGDKFANLAPAFSPARVVVARTVETLDYEQKSAHARNGSPILLLMVRAVGYGAPVRRSLLSTRRTQPSDQHCSHPHWPAPSSHGWAHVSASMRFLELTVWGRRGD